MEINRSTAHKLHRLLKSGEIRAKEVTEAVIRHIEAIDSQINAYITKTFDLALDQARRVDEKIARGEEIHPLEGIPIVIKDNICTRGIRTTCGSKILHNFIPPYDATVIERLKMVGAVIIGKTNMDEFDIGSSNETSFFGPAHNPWDLERVPGGSSGGSCAAVAADETILALGSDTGGSIRQPASLCGVVGLKPTYGRVSRYGLIGLASSLDQIGPITKDIEDCAILMNLIAGHDPCDSISIDCKPPDYTRSLVSDVSGIRLGIPKEYFGREVDPNVKEVVEEAIKTLEELGAQVCEVSLPHIEYSTPVYCIISSSEGSSSLAKYDGIQYGYKAEESKLVDIYKKTRGEGFGDEAKRTIILGTYVLSAGHYDTYYLKAQKVRTLIRQDFKNAFEECNLIVTPTSPTPAFKIGRDMEDPVEMYLYEIFTNSANLVGIPAISIPCGFSQIGLPIGLQFLGPPFSEDLLIRIAYTFEQNTDHHLKKPSIKMD